MVAMLIIQCANVLMCRILNLTFMCISFENHSCSIFWSGFITMEIKELLTSEYLKRVPIDSPGGGRIPISRWRPTAGMNSCQEGNCATIRYSVEAWSQGWRKADHRVRVKRTNNIEILEGKIRVIINVFIPYGT